MQGSYAGRLDMRLELGWSPESPEKLSSVALCGILNQRLSQFCSVILPEKEKCITWSE